MKLSFNPRDIACIVESNLYIREVEVVKAGAAYFDTWQWFNLSNT